MHLKPLPTDYHPESILILCDGQKAVHVEGSELQLDVEWTAEQEPDRLEMFWDGVLVYAQVNQQITLNRLQLVTGSVHPMDWIFQAQAGQADEPTTSRNP